VAQAQEAVPNKAVAAALILVGLFVEVFMSARVVSGIAERACAFVLAGYCATMRRKPAAKAKFFQKSQNSARASPR
jgi:hypothetical protein